MDCAYIVNLLKRRGIKCAEGLNDQEVSEIEARYDFRFPPDLKEFLMYALPLSNPFVNWRDTSEENRKQISDRLAAPLEGIIVDIEHNGFWMADWGKKPSSLDEASAIATEAYQKAPKLIPIYAHRYIPATPVEYGNPIFSVHQTDIIFYGDNLTNYFGGEFGLMKQQDIDFKNLKDIPFWTKMVWLNSL